MNAPSSPSSGPWWLPNAIVMGIGVILVGIGVYDRDNQALLVLGSSLASAAAGHMIASKP